MDIHRNDSEVNSKQYTTSRAAWNSKGQTDCALDVRGVYTLYELWNGDSIVGG